MENFLTPNFMKTECIAGNNFLNFGKDQLCTMGIDEAGRGPVLGPMVYACAISITSQLDKVTNLKVNDSKVLTEKQRSKIFDEIVVQKFLTYSIELVSPQAISASMTNLKKCSLNKISHNCAIHLIQKAIRMNINLAEIYVDTVGPKNTYQELLEKLFPNLKIVVAEKADSLYSIVSAASIIAKVTRDSKIKTWKFLECNVNIPNEGYGSGYPADPLTKKFLINSIQPIFGYSNFVRFSWKTIETILEKQAVKCKWEYKSSKVLTLINLWNNSKTLLKKHIHFHERQISNAVNF